MRAGGNRRRAGAQSHHLGVGRDGDSIVERLKSKKGAEPEKGGEGDKHEENYRKQHGSGGRGVFVSSALWMQVSCPRLSGQTDDRLRLSEMGRGFAICAAEPASPTAAGRIFRSPPHDFGNRVRRDARSSGFRAPRLPIQVEEYREARDTDSNRARGNHSHNRTFARRGACRATMREHCRSTL